MATPVPDAATLVEKSYDAIAKQREGDLESQKTPFRHFNNFVKKRLIQNVMDSVREFKGTDEPLGSSSTTGSAIAVRVLDLGSGRGGDLGKWAYACSPLAPNRGGAKKAAESPGCKAVCTWYECYDISPECIREAKRREEAMKLPEHFRCSFTVANCFSSEFLLGTLTESPSYGAFHCVSIQFALHYGCQSEESIDTLMRGIAGALRPGGCFVATIVDSAELARRIESRRLSNSMFAIRVISGGIARVGPNTTPARRSRTEESLRVGTQYHFRLSGFVDCAEYVVPFRALSVAAARYGMLNVPEFSLPFNAFFAEYARQRNGLQLSEPERELCDLYRTVYFEKMANFK